MARRTADDWIDAAFAALVEGGPAALGVEPIARRLRVTKGSFYWHFDDRSDLLRAMLTRWEQLATEQVIREVDAASGSPTERLSSLTALSFSSASGYGTVEAAIRGWALTDDAAAAAVVQVDRRRLGYVTALLVDAGIDRDTAADRSAIYYRALIGEFTWCSYRGAALSAGALDQLLTMMTAEPAGTDVG